MLPANAPSSREPDPSVPADTPGAGESDAQDSPAAAAPRPRARTGRTGRTAAPGGGGALLWLLSLPLLLLSWGMDLLLSRRGVALGLLGFMALLAAGPWVRPPISKDIRSTQISLGIWEGSQFHPEELAADRRWRADSVAAPLIATCAFGAIVVLIQPQSLAVIAGTMLALSLAGTGALMLNHPSLINTLDREFYQRNEIRRMMAVHEDFSLSSKSLSRIDLRRQRNGLVAISTDPDDATHGWYYLVWSPWLIALCWLTIIFSTRGSWRHRLGGAATWTLLGLALGAGVTARRWVAEHHWREVARLENANDFEGAARALNRVRETFPDFDEIERTWLVQGRLDGRLGLRTLAAELFRARQNRLHTPRPVFQWAVQAAPESRAVINLAADALFSGGKRAYLEKNFDGARDYWDEARRLAPWRFDCLIGLAVVFEHVEVRSPELVLALVAPLLPEVGDRLIRADMQSLVGDAYFEAGDPSEARRYYRASMKTFTLPRFINPHAQEAMLGM